MRPMTVFIIALALDPVVALAKNEGKTPKIVMPEAFADSVAEKKQWALAMTTIMPPSSDAPRVKISANLFPGHVNDNEVGRKRAAAYKKNAFSQALLNAHQARAADAQGAATMTGKPVATKIKVKGAASKSEKVPVSFRPGHTPVLDKLVPQLKSARAITFQRAKARPILRLRKVH